MIYEFSININDLVPVTGKINPGTLAEIHPVLVHLFNFINYTKGRENDT